MHTSGILDQNTHSSLPPYWNPAQPGEDAHATSQSLRVPSPPCQRRLENKRRQR